MDSPDRKVRKICTETESPHFRKNIQDNDQGPSDENEENRNQLLPTKLHPLTDIDLVLSKIISYLDLCSVIKDASLVCKTWSNVARKLMVKNMTFHFSEQDALEFLQESVQSSYTSIKDYIVSISIKLSMGRFERDCVNNELKFKTKTISYGTAFALVEKLLTMNIVLIDLKLRFCVKDILDAWKIICYLNEQLHHLDINTDCTCCKESRPRVQAIIEGNEDIPVANPFHVENLAFPKLKTLTGQFKEKLITGVNTSGDNVWKLFQGLIVSSPDLQDLHCQLYSMRNDVFDIFRENPDVLQNLKSLSGVCVNQDELLILSQKNLRLNSLSITLYSGFRYPALSPFLSSQGETLKSLEIDFLNLTNVPEKFQCGVDLVNMTHLRMKKFFGSIHFVSHMSNLESLTLEDMNLTVALHDEAAKYLYKSKLKSLRIIGGKGSTGRFLLPAIYYEITSYFPELRILRMEYFTDSTLKIILKGLPHLEELDMPNGIYSDAVIDGDRTSEDGAEVIEVQNCYPHLQLSGSICLLDVKGLRKVVLQSPKITDHCIRYGLLKCKELRSISLNSPLISDTGLKLLCQRQDLQQLEFINCYQLTSSGISEAKELWGKGKTLAFLNE